MEESPNHNAILTDSVQQTVIVDEYLSERRLADLWNDSSAFRER